MTHINVNGEVHELVDIADTTPLLWILRDHLGLTGTKYGCGVSECGACTVHINGAARQSCVTTLSEVADAHVVTIEGLSADGSHPVQKAWKQHSVPPCGYCQVGQIMAAAAMLRDNTNPSDADIDNRMWNICRCGTYPRIHAAVRTAAQELRK
tara:strand:- start:56 stop:514 length:459 start_codon:yes stop_codon:yes gene_type:complete